jgi:CBS-domain-containing membrane protein
LAIVDDNGCLVDVLSVSDLRLLGEDMTQIQRVTKTVEEFSSHKVNTLPPITVLCCDTVAYVSFFYSTKTNLEVAQRFSEHKIHRLYVVDDDNKPIGIIGLGDFIRLFISK